MGVLKKAKQHSLVADVVSQVEETILSRRIKPGERLPASRDLQSILGASLGTIREAVAILEQKGLVEVKKGAKGGIFVKEASTDSVSEGLGLLIRQLSISYEELAEFRQVNEAAVMRLVARRASDDELSALDDYMDDFRRALNLGDQGWKHFLATEVNLRKHLIELTKNRTYNAVLRPIHDNIMAYTDKLLPGEKRLVREAFTDWESIIEALKKRDGDTAADITSDHIGRFLNHVKE
ncbi:GntR family transcriptional regulator [Dethiosulfatarculus sandiegensis]|uniref:GntR family transcriptional regulator n=1 Tax=Dethiosulfatarculus sandiegensis TaxID=1429043 RepID=A0A0D2IYQ5_9BACT|nr:GntR family transcriptional regulator [Dethiosulfatarculus sandiegensis]